MPDLLQASGRSHRLNALYQQATGAAALVVSRGIGVAAQIAVQIAVGALAGPAGIGTLQLHMAWSSVLGELVGAGEPTRAMRDTAVLGAGGNGRHIRQNLSTAAGRILRFGLLAAIAGLLLTAVMDLLGFASFNRLLFASAVVAAPIFALTRLCAEALKSLGQATWAVTLENSAVPLTLLFLCALLSAGGWSLSMSLLLLAAVSGLVLGLAAMLLRLRHTLSGEDDGEVESPAPAGTLTTKRENLHFWLNGLLNIAFIQLPFLILPMSNASVQDIGVYAVAHKLLNVITTLLILMAAVFGPRFARAAAAAQVHELRRLLLNTQIFSTLIFLPAALLMIGLSESLAALFRLGSDSLGPLLLLLAAGQLVNAGTGLSGVLLNMTGAAGMETRLLLLSSLLTLGVGLLLGQQAGAAGIAIAISIGIALRNVLSYAAARQHLRTMTESTV